jgi:hypothetical protein
VVDAVGAMARTEIVSGYSTDARAAGASKAPRAAIKTEIWSERAMVMTVF